ncbi:hypothetical protein MVEG_03336 [Podila verticillata NRRL 6337]|nr:hypothetical protein MVEG_03336 [Podila verticillata NRRL 6337]
MRQSKRPKPDVVLLSDDESKGGHVTKKFKERTSAEVLSKGLNQSGSVVSKMKKSSDVHTIARSKPIVSHPDAADICPSISNYAPRQSILPKLKLVPEGVKASPLLSRTESTAKSKPSPPSSPLSLSPSSPQRIGKIDPLCSPSKTQALGMGTFPRATLTKVRVGKQEFIEPGMAVQFGPDRVIIDIGSSVTKIPHSEIKIVEFFTDNPTKLLQINTSGKLPETSVLSPFYDPTPNSNGARKIVLYSNGLGSIFLDFCVKLNKIERINVKSMTSDIVDRCMAPVEKKSPKPMSRSPDEILFVFPFKTSAKSKSIAVRQQDVDRLDDDEFLNDTLIELGLKYVHTKIELSNKNRAAETYIFNSFFYERLISGASKESIISYDAVKSWTNKVDLFSMKYIIVPIHENMHWYLAVIVNPHLLLREESPSSMCSSPIVDSSPDTTPSQSEQATNGESGDSDAKSSRSSVSSLLDDSDALLDQLLLRGRARSSPPRRSTRNIPAVPIDVEEKTMILVMDSLGGQHSSVFKTLRAYLQQELLTRKNITKTLGVKEVLARYATKAPKQENFCDCGLYLLHYAEMFLTYPKRLSDSIVNKSDGTTCWELSKLPTKRQDYRNLVADLTAQYKIYQQEMAAVKS